MEEAVKAIQQANRVFLFGVGTSGITAEDAKNKLMRIGVQVDATGNNHFMYMQASLLTKKDVAIGLSHSGYSQETTHTMKIAKRKWRQNHCDYAQFAFTYHRICRSCFSEW